MPVIAFPTTTASPIRFSPAARDALLSLAYNLHVEVAVEADDDGDEWAAIGPGDGSDYAWFMVIAGRPMILKDRGFRVVGTFGTGEELRAALMLLLEPLAALGSQVATGR